MSEDHIIAQRVLISEVHYKRIAKISSDIVNLTNPTTAQINSLRESIILETYAYEAMLKKLQLQLNANDSETRHYRNEMNLSQQKINRLSTRTQLLQNKLTQEQIQRARNEEYSKYVEDFSKPRKFTTTEHGEPFLAVLNTSRKDAVSEIENLEAEIAELESLQGLYRETWEKRKTSFQHCVETLNSFKEEIDS